MMNRFIHRLQLPSSSGTQYPFEWQVDLDAAGQCTAWARGDLSVLVEDVTGMATYFPHWVLAGMCDDQPTYCPRCQALVVPLDGGMRCLRCVGTVVAGGLAWVGQLPVLSGSGSTFEQIRSRLAGAGFAEITVQQQGYLLVPITVVYPPLWRQEEPHIYYAPRWLQAMGLPRASATHHLIAGGRACLYGWNDWQPAPIHEVLQQRMINHVLSLCKIAAGQPAGKAFIGRSDH